MEAHRKPLTLLLLTQEHCGFCEQAKEMLERLAVEYPLAVTTLDVSSPEGQTRALQGAILFPPGIFFDNEPFSYGRPSERKLRREIEKRLKEKTYGTPTLE